MHTIADALGVMRMAVDAMRGRGAAGIRATSYYGILEFCRVRDALLLTYWPRIVNPDTRLCNGPAHFDIDALYRWAAAMDMFVARCYLSGAAELAVTLQACTLDSTVPPQLLHLVFMNTPQFVSTQIEDAADYWLLAKPLEPEWSIADARQWHRGDLLAAATAASVPPRKRSRRIDLPGAEAERIFRDIDRH